MVERGAATKSQKREKSQRGKEGGRMISVEGTWTNVRKETHVVSLMNTPLETVTEVTDEKGQSSSPAPNSKAKTDGE